MASFHKQTPSSSGSLSSSSRLKTRLPTNGDDPDSNLRTRLKEILLSPPFNETQLARPRCSRHTKEEEKQVMIVTKELRQRVKDLIDRNALLRKQASELASENELLKNSLIDARVSSGVASQDMISLEARLHAEQLSSSAMNWKLRDFEGEMLKKEEKTRELERTLLQMEEILEKVAGERDVAVEKNKGLSSEVDSLRRKVEELDEQVVYKDGQLVIARDNLLQKGYTRFDPCI